MVGTQAEIGLLQSHVAAIDTQIALLIIEIAIDLVERGLQFANLLASLPQDVAQQTFRPPYRLALPQQAPLDVIVNQVDAQSALPVTPRVNFRRKSVVWDKSAPNGKRFNDLAARHLSQIAKALRLTDLSTSASRSL